MKLYGTPSSPYTRKVRVLGLKKRLDIEFVNETPLKPDSRIPVLNPLGKIPALLRDDGTVLIDSPLIAEYLDALNDAPRFLPAIGPERMAVRQWESLCDGVLDAAVLIRMESLRPEAQRSEDWIAAQNRKIERTLDVLDRSLGRNDRSVGQSLSLADIATACAVLYLEFRFPQGEWRKRFANLGRLTDEMADRAAFLATPIDA